VCRYADTPLIVALPLSHSDKTKFLQWSQIARDKKSLGLSQENFKMTSGTVEFFDTLQAFWDPLRRKLLHVQIFMNVGNIPLT